MSAFKEGDMGWVRGTVWSSKYQRQMSGWLKCVVVKIDKHEDYSDVEMLVTRYNTEGTSQEKLVHHVVQFELDEPTFLSTRPCRVADPTIDFYHYDDIPEHELQYVL